jgi:hypothetical protein
MEDCAKSANTQGLMVGNDNASVGRFPAENDMTPALPLDNETKSLERLTKILT